MKNIKNRKLYMFLAVILMLMLAVSLAGCGDAEATEGQDVVSQDGDGYIDVATAGGDESDDLSKYEEKTDTQTSGNTDNASKTDQAANSQSSGGSNSGSAQNGGGNGSGNSGNSGSGNSASSGEKDQYETDINSIPEGEPTPVEPQKATVNKAKSGSCTLLIECSTILNNMADFNTDKMSVLPSDGIILSQRTVTFYEGESVFDVLLRETRNNNIHMEYEMTPIYNSNYIEGINNLYEFDCGNLSGWMYCVNGWYPNYGCSRYQVKEGDVIEWHFTCDLGADLGQDVSQWE